MEVVVSATVEDRINLSRDMDPSPSRCASDLASESPPCTVDSPDRDDQFSSSPNLNKVSESQVAIIILVHFGNSLLNLSFVFSLFGFLKNSPLTNL